MTADGELPPEDADSWPISTAFRAPLEDTDSDSDQSGAPPEDTDSESGEAEAPPEGSDWYTGPIVAPPEGTDSEAGPSGAPPEGLDPNQFKKDFARQSADLSDQATLGFRDRYTPTAGFHTTREGNVPSVMNSGLDPQRGGGPGGASEAMAESDPLSGENFAKNSAGKIHYTSSLRTASKFKNFLDENPPDDSSDAGKATILGANLEGTVWPYDTPPPWDDPTAPEAVRALAPGQPAQVERDSEIGDHSDDENEIQEDDGEGDDERKPFDMQAFRTTGPVPPENIVPTGLNTDIPRELDIRKRPAVAAPNQADDPGTSSQANDPGTSGQDYDSDGSGLEYVTDPEQEPASDSESFSDSGSVMQFRTPGASMAPTQPDSTMETDNTMEPPEVDSTTEPPEMDGTV